MVDIPADDYSPTSPAHSGYAPTSPTALMAPPLVEQEQTMAVPPAEHAAQIPVPLSLPTSPASRRSRSQPPSVAEPGAEPAVPTPHHGEQPSAELDPETAALYEPVDGESFQERRNRFNRQETISFGPWRHQGRRDSTPYETADHPRSLSTSEPLSSPQAEQDPDAALLSQAFTISEITANCLPKGWNFEDGYFQLDKRPMDHWEVKAGCLIRHHVVPRRQKMSLQHLPRDSPFPAAELDNVRVTVVYDTNGRCRQFTDDGSCCLPPVDTSWTGVTVFQIRGPVRKELAMYAKEPLVGAKQMGKISKQRHAKAFKKDKNNLSERTMTPDERAQFKAAKVKELQSFFDNQVWTFETTKEAEPTRTLTSRMLLKWSELLGRKPDSSFVVSWTLTLGKELCLHHPLPQPDCLALSC